MTWQGSIYIEQATRARGARTRLAEAVGKDLATVSRWANGSRPEATLWPAIEAHLGLAPGTLGDTVTSPVDLQLQGMQSQLDDLRKQLGQLSAMMGDLVALTNVVATAVQARDIPGAKAR